MIPPASLNFLTKVLQYGGDLLPPRPGLLKIIFIYRYPVSASLKQNPEYYPHFPIEIKI